MRRAWLAAAILGGTTLLLIAIAPPASRLPLARVAVFAVGLVAAVRVVRRIAPATAPAADPFDIDPAPPASPSEIAGLRRIEFDVEMATVHPFGIQWVRPLLTELARGRLLGDRGIDMERAPDAARQVLGEPTWRLIDPDAGRWSTAGNRVSAAELEAGAERLEQV